MVVYLNGEIFGNLREAEILTDKWVTFYNTIRPHFSLHGRAPQTIVPKMADTNQAKSA